MSRACLTVCEGRCPLSTKGMDVLEYLLQLLHLRLLGWALQAWAADLHSLPDPWLCGNGCLHSPTDFRFGIRGHQASAAAVKVSVGPAQQRLHVVSGPVSRHKADWAHKAQLETRAEPS